MISERSDPENPPDAVAAPIPPAQLGGGFARLVSLPPGANSLFARIISLFLVTGNLSLSI